MKNRYNKFTLDILFSANTYLKYSSFVAEI